MVAFGRDHDDVVAAFQFVERMVCIDLLQTDLAGSVFHLGDETEMFVFCFQLLAILLKTLLN